MELFEAIEKRHSYRGEFVNEPVPKDDLRKIVEAGIKAPSGKNCQSTDFVIVDDQDKVSAIREIMEKPFLKNAPAFIICATDPTPVYNGHSFHVEDCSAAVENMLLAITALGYASVWIDGYLRQENRAERIANLLGIPDSRQVRILLPVGKPVEEMQQKEKKPFGERAWFNQYGA